MSDESNILVAIRVRPMNQKELNNDDWDIVRIEDNLIIILDPVQMEFEAENKKMLEVYHRSKEQRYAFDKIYEQTCKQLIRPVMNGYNATVFAYGPTGTGKTFTMLGYSDQMGLSVLTIQDMFEQIKRDEDNEYTVMITYVEIYNEMIRDLLVTQASYLELRDDPIKGVMISGVTEYKALSTQQVMTLLLTGNKRRMTEATNANQTSSRSHAVFQIVVTQRSRYKNTEQESFVGKLSLIDLAGSERGTVTENRGLRLREGAKINRSLLALANCINALGDKSKKGFFVPYRDSKLTRLLKDSLGGNCKTVMIANISPSSSQFEETINTLKYANRAKNIKTKQIANKKLVQLHIAEYKNIITDLRSEIEQLRARLQEKNYYQEDGEDESQPTYNNYVLGQKKHQSYCPQCDKQEDQEELRKIQEEIYENFQERIQLRRALMEIEEQNAMNFLEIKKKQGELVTWRKGNETNGESKLPEEMKQNVRGIQTLKTSSDKNMIKKELMGLQLIENINNAKRIREQIPKRIHNKDKRDFLELEIKNHVLELQNIELEINLQIQEKTIQDLKNIIDNQRKLIQEEQEEVVDDVELEYIDDLDEEEDEVEDNDDDLEDLQELEQFKELIEKQKQIQLKSSSPEPQKLVSKRDKSAPPKKPSTQKQQQQQLQQQFDFSVNGVNILDNDDESNVSLIQGKQKVREDSRSRQLNNNNSINKQQNNSNKVIVQSKGSVPPIPKQPQQQLQQQQQNKDISSLNLQGVKKILKQNIINQRNMVLNQQQQQQFQQQGITVQRKKRGN